MTHEEAGITLQKASHLVPGRPLGKSVQQLGYLVEDIDQAMTAWTRLVGIGPWLCYRNVKVWGTYLGEPTTVTMHVALTYQDQMQIELIQPLNNAASPYKAFTDQGRWGLHHYAYLVDDIEVAVERAQQNELEVAFDITNGLSRYVYLRSAALADVFIEFIEAAPSFLKQFAEGIALAKQWRGENPVTNIDLAELNLDG